MKRIIKNTFKVTLIFALCAICYFCFGLSDKQELFKGGLLLAFIGIVIAAMIAVMIFIYNISQQITEQIDSYASDKTKKSIAQDSLLNGIRELKEDSIVIVVGCSVIMAVYFIIPLLAADSIWADLANVIILGLLANIALAIFDCLFSFSRIFNTILYRKKDIQN